MGGTWGTAALSKTEEEGVEMGRLWGRRGPGRTKREKDTRTCEKWLEKMTNAWCRGSRGAASGGRVVWRGSYRGAIKGAVGVFYGFP